MALVIDSAFPGGSIEIVRAPARGAIELALRSDSAADIRQWFNFSVTSGSAKPRDLVIVNASESSFPNGWPGYQATVARGRGFGRIATDYDGQTLSFVHQPSAEPTHYSYFAPYGVDRLERLLARVNRSSAVDVSELGQSVEGRPVYLADFGDRDAARTFWIIARQHPGETPASWLVEGLLKRLICQDASVALLLRQVRLVIVPLVNPDGAELGNHRTSASGVNLNRVWDDPDPDEAPEVAAILDAIGAIGVDLFLDVHADEASAFAFAASSEGNPSYNEVIAEAEAALRFDLAELTPEFVDEPVYPLDDPGQADLSCAASFIGEAFGCPSITLELPILSAGDARVRSGWSSARAERFGRALVDVLLRAADRGQ